MKYCPENLEELEIKLLEFGLFEWLLDVPLSAVCDFASRVSKINRLSLITDEDYSRYNRPRDFSEMRIDPFYQMLDALRGDRKIVSCKAHFSNSNTEKHINNISITGNSSLSYKFHIVPYDNYPEYYASRFPGYAVPKFAIPTPAISCPTEPQTINYLTLDIDDSKLTGSNFLLEGCLDYADQNCPQLISFDLRCYDETDGPTILIFAR